MPVRLYSVQKKKKINEPPANVRCFGYDALSVVLDNSQGRRGLNGKVTVAQCVEHSSVTLISGYRSLLMRLFFESKRSKTEQDGIQKAAK
jgi:hypothetical protein